MGDINKGVFTNNSEVQNSGYDWDQYCKKIIIVDRHHVDDPDPSFYFDADPDPGIYTSFTHVSK
jgi:hypothetical protein